MKSLAVLGLIALLASCGVQSEPIRPTANVGLSIGANGVTPTASVGAQSGPLSVSLGL